MKAPVPAVMPQVHNLCGRDRWVAAFLSNRLWTYSKRAAAKLPTTRTPRTGADLILINSDTEYCGKLEMRDCRLYVSVTGIAPPGTRVHHQRANGICERIRKAIFYVVSGLPSGTKYIFLLKDIRPNWIHGWSKQHGTKTRGQTARCAGTEYPRMGCLTGKSDGMKWRTAGPMGQKEPQCAQTARSSPSRPPQKTRNTWLSKPGAPLLRKTRSQSRLSQRSSSADCLRTRYSQRAWHLSHPLPASP